MCLCEKHFYYSLYFINSKLTNKVAKAFKNIFCSQYKKGFTY